jgi:hypothetical protein
VFSSQKFTFRVDMLRFLKVGICSYRYHCYYCYCRFPWFPHFSNAASPNRFVCPPRCFLLQEIRKYEAGGSSNGITYISSFIKIRPAVLDFKHAHGRTSMTVPITGLKLILNTDVSLLVIAHSPLQVVICLICASYVRTFEVGIYFSFYQLSAHLLSSIIKHRIPYTTC